MSLINKMLKDLETRQNSPQGRPVSRPVYQDLHAVSETGTPRPILPIVALTVLVLVIAAGLVFWLLNSAPATDNNTTQTIMPAPAPPAISPPSVEPPVMVEQSEVVAVVTSVTEAPMVTSPELPAEFVTQKTAAPEPVKTSPVKAVAPRPVAPPAAVTAAKHPARNPAPVAVTVPAESVMPGASIEKKEIPLTPEQVAENAYREAAQQVQQRYLPEAEKSLRTALASNPRHVAARELLASLLLLETSRMEQARELLEQGLVVVPGQSGFITLLARIYVEQNTEPKAIALLEQQRNKNTGPDSLALLATLYQRAARHDEAITAFKDALVLRPQEGKWWLGLGISQEAKLNWNEARYAYEQVRVTSIEPRLAQYAEQRLAVVRTK